MEGLNSESPRWEDGLRVSHRNIPELCQKYIQVYNCVTIKNSTELERKRLQLHFKRRRGLTRGDVMRELKLCILKTDISTLR